jgi:hypothetical protein
MERRPHLADLAIVRQALAAAGVPASDALLEFHERYAGLVSPGLDEFVWGLVHENPRWLEPLTVEADNDDGSVRVICADAHPSYYLQLDVDGVHYTTCGVPRALRFETLLEQHACVVDWARTAGQVSAYRLELRNDPRELAEVLIPRLADCIVSVASDACGAIYATNELLLEHYVHFDFFQLHVRAGTHPDSVRDFRLERGDLEDPLTVPLLRRALVDAPDEHGRMAAIDSLRRLGAVEALPDLLARISRDEDYGTCNFAMSAVLKLGGHAGQAAFIRALEHQEKFVRRSAVLALRDVGDAAAIPALEALLDDPAVPEAGPAGDQRKIADEARDAITAIRNRLSGTPGGKLR